MDRKTLGQVGLRNPPTFMGKGLSIAHHAPFPFLKQPMHGAGWVVWIGLGIEPLILVRRYIRKSPPGPQISGPQTTKEAAPRHCVRGFRPAGHRDPLCVLEAHVARAADFILGLVAGFMPKTGWALPRLI